MATALSAARALPERDCRFIACVSGYTARQMAVKTKGTTGVLPDQGNAQSLSPAQEAGPDLPSRDDVPDWVPSGQEERWRNSENVAEQMFPGNHEMVWSTSRMIFNDPETYPS